MNNENISEIKVRGRVQSQRRSRLKRMRQSIGWFEVIVYPLLIGWAIISLLPLYWMFTTSFRVSTHIMEMPPKFWPEPATLENYRRLILNASVARWFLNSVIVTGTITIINVVFCTLAGYTLGKKSFPGRSLIFWSIIGMMMVPGQVTLVPLFMLMADLHFVNSYLGLIIPSLFAPFGIFLMKQFIQSLPSELIEAAKIDGAGEISVFARIIFPLSKPGWAALAIFMFVESWNDFLWPLIITNSETMRTLQVGLATLQTRYLTDYSLLLAGAAISSLPMIVLFLAFQSYFVRGITIGSVKG
jgi:multiple sugar transport system permease protein